MTGVPCRCNIEVSSDELDLFESLNNIKLIHPGLRQGNDCQRQPGNLIHFKADFNELINLIHK